jgi:hypothetical protein
VVVPFWLDGMTTDCSSALHERHTEAEPLARIEYELMDVRGPFEFVSLGAVVFVEDPIPVVAEPFSGLVDIGDLHTNGPICPGPPRAKRSAKGPSPPNGATNSIDPSKSVAERTTTPSMR